MSIPLPNRIGLKDDEEYKRNCLISSPPPALPSGIAFADQKVTLRAIVGKDGTILELSPLGGDSALLEAAIDSVRQSWSFRPLKLNDMPVEVVTQLEVRFCAPSGMIERP